MHTKRWLRTEYYTDQLRIAKTFQNYNCTNNSCSRIGISRFDNPQRSDVAYEIFNEILQGVKLKIDPDGNIWAKRMCYSPVFLKPLYRNKPNDLFIIDQTPVKVSRFVY